MATPRSHERILDSVDIVPHPGDGVWIEAIMPDDGGTWYGHYHHERPANRCGRGNRAIPRIGAARSVDRGRTWEDLGFVLEASPSTDACQSSNRFVVGGVGDVTRAARLRVAGSLLVFSQYVRDRAAQGVAVARIVWADRDEPVGKIAVWQDGAWLPATGPRRTPLGVGVGTPLVAARGPGTTATATPRRSGDRQSTGTPTSSST